MKNKIKTFEDYKNVELTDSERRVLNLKSELICNLIDARLSAGETQVSLGQKTQIQQPMLARIENEISDPKVTTLIKLLDGIGKKIIIVDQDAAAQSNNTE